MSRNFLSPSASSFSSDKSILKSCNSNFLFLTRISSTLFAFNIRATFFSLYLKFKSKSDSIEFTSTSSISHYFLLLQMNATFFIFFLFLNRLFILSTFVVVAHTKCTFSNANKHEEHGKSHSKPRTIQSLVGKCSKAHTRNSMA
jgi:hypothetical protein